MTHPSSLQWRRRILSGLGALALSVHPIGYAQKSMTLIPPGTTTSTAPTPQNHPYLGMWVTDKGDIRHELLPSGRYDEQRGQRKSAYVGKYWVKGNRIEYLDDTGFTADGEFRDGVFHHGGYLFRRAPAEKR